MSPRRTSGVVVPVGRHRIDEGLIVSLLIARGDEGRLAVCLADEFWGVHIGNPDLNRPQSLLPQSLAILPHSVASGCHTTMLHVTRRSACGGTPIHDGKRRLVWGQNWAKLSEQGVPASPIRCSRAVLTSRNICKFHHFTCAAVSSLDGLRRLIDNNGSWPAHSRQGHPSRTTPGQGGDSFRPGWSLPARSTLSRNRGQSRPAGLSRVGKAWRGRLGRQSVRARSSRGSH